MAVSWRKVLKAPRKLFFTADGRWFTAITLLLGVGAVNTGANLLYLLLGMLLGLIVASGILSERMLREVTVKRLPTGDIFAGRPTSFRWEVTNSKRWFSSFTLVIREHEARATRARRRVALGLPADPPTRRKKREAEADPGPPAGLALRVPAGRSVVVTGTPTFPHRGLYQYVGIDLGTRFPFGFFEKSRAIEMSSEVLVYPALFDDPGALTEEDYRQGEVERAREGQGGEFHGLREFRDGDDRRDVHWKVSARRGKLVRRLYEREDNEAVALHLYNWLPPGLTGESHRLAHASMETTISGVASTCARLAKEGRRYALHTIDARVHEGDGAGQLQAALRHLAMLEIRSDSEAPPMQLSGQTNRILFATRFAPASVVKRFEQRWRNTKPDSTDREAA